MWRDRFYKENEYIIKILISANLIKNRRELLFNPNSDEGETGYEISDKINNELNSKIKLVESRLDIIEKDQKDAKVSVAMLEDKVKHISNEVESVKQECKSIHTKMDNYNQIQTKRLDDIEKVFKKNIQDSAKNTDARIEASRLEILNAINRK